jgi:hypothetical protein
MRLFNALRCRLRGAPRTAGDRRARACPTVEALEGREVPAIVFGHWTSGLHAYNADTGTWRDVDMAGKENEKPKFMDEGYDGRLFATFSDGTYAYTYATDHWSKLTGASAAQTLAMGASSDGALFLASTTGTHRWWGNVWTTIEDNAAKKIAAVSKDQMYAVYADGTWRWKPSGGGGSPWKKLSAHKATAIDATPEGVLFASYADGTWKYQGGWDHLTAVQATKLDAASTTVAYITASGGTWRIDGAAVSKISNSKATAMTHDSDLGMVAAIAGDTWVYSKAGGWWVLDDDAPDKLAQ